MAATRNAACAVGLGDRVGSLQPGSQADLWCWTHRIIATLAYRFGTNPVRLVVKSGRVVVDRGATEGQPRQRAGRTAVRRATCTPVRGCSAARSKRQRKVADG